MVSVNRPTLYPGQEKTLDLRAGETAYVKVASIRTYNSGIESYDPDTFAVVVVHPADGQRDIASKWYFPNGS